jgi:hypothetical protein
MRKLKNLTEKEAVDIIYKVARRLAPKYRFGYHSIEDMVQVAVEMALKKIETKYDEDRPLENFLAIVLRNGLFNYKRDNYERLEKPCNNCPLKAYIKNTDLCTAYESKLECKHYNIWDSGNVSRKNIMCAIDIDGVDDDKEKNMSTSSNMAILEKKEIIEFIEKNIPVEMYKDWLKLKTGNKIANKKKRELIETIKDILKDIDYV